MSFILSVSKYFSASNKDRGRTGALLLEDRDSFDDPSPKSQGAKGRGKQGAVRGQGLQRGRGRGKGQQRVNKGQENVRPER